MAYLDLLRTVHLPAEADGNAIKNSFGVVIATAVDPVTATALADLINLGMAPAAEARERHRKGEAALASALFKGERA